MRAHEFAHGGVEHAVELAPGAAAGAFAAVVRAGDARFEVAFSATPLGEGRWLVRVGDEVHDVRIERDARGAGVRVRFPDGTVTLERLDPFRDRVRTGRQGGGARRIVAPIPGRVVDVLVKAGDGVVAGQPVVIVEAMKMANELRSPADGRIASVAVEKGVAVEAGTTLVVVET